MTHYLVTGGLGFLGSALARALARRGEPVRVLDDGSRGALSRLDDLTGRIEVVWGDVRDAGAVSRAVQGMDCVCHFACINGTCFFYERPRDVLEVAIKGMIHVLDACVEHGVRRLLFASSSEVYQTPPEVPTRETVPLAIPDPYNPRYSYAGGKLCSELLAIHYGALSFDQVLIVRPHNVFGPDMGHEHVIPQLASRLARLRGETTERPVPLPIQGTGNESRSFIPVDDFTGAVLLLLDRGGHLETYNIGTQDERTVAELVQQIAHILGVEAKIQPGPLAPGSPSRRCPDTRKLEHLGFRPSRKFHDALLETVTWYESHPSPNAITRGDGSGASQ